MTLNLRAATIVATIAALLASFGNPRLAAYAADRMPSSVSTNPFDFTAEPAALEAKTTSPNSGIGAAASPFVHSEPHPVAPFPLLLNRAVQEYVNDFLDRPAGIKLAFERSRPFLPEMIKLMKQQGIPDDLVYLTFAESDFSKRGKGPW